MDLRRRSLLPAITSLLRPPTPFLFSHTRRRCPAAPTSPLTGAASTHAIPSRADSPRLHSRIRETLASRTARLRRNGSNWCFSLRRHQARNSWPSPDSKVAAIEGLCREIDAVTHTPCNGPYIHKDGERMDSSLSSVRFHRPTLAGGSSRCALLCYARAGTVRRRRYRPSRPPPPVAASSSATPVLGRFGSASE